MATSLERFSYVLEMNMRQHTKNNKPTRRNQFDWRQTHTDLVGLANTQRKACGSREAIFEVTRLSAF